MNGRLLRLALAVVGCAFSVTLAHAQRRPYIGYTYPAGGQQATTFQVKLGGQDLDDVSGVLVSGDGVTARVLDYQRRLSPQEMQLLRDQLRDLKQGISAIDSLAPAMITKIEKRIREWVQQPACASIASIVIAEVTIGANAAPGQRELRLQTPRGISNPLVFHVGELPEFARKPMLTARIQVLGKEALALRDRPESEIEQRITLPCTVNGQIAAREVNRYRFAATKGQRLVLSAQARQLIPFIADAVPGWFQPVLVLYDAQGREVAFADDYRFKPDPVILYQVPQDGEYVMEIRDSLYRGREDFIYRISVGELPFVTGIFPLGGVRGAALPLSTSGWNVSEGDLAAPRTDRLGVQMLGAQRQGLGSNRVPFIVDSLPDQLEHETNNAAASAEKIAPPVVINGRIDSAGDVDVFQFSGRAGEAVVIDVMARRLDSPLDAIVTLTDASGRLVAVNDDREDVGTGVNTHAADSMMTAKLPAEGTYFVQLADTARQGGPEYGYRLRVGAPQPDFELRVVPSSLSLAVNASAALTVYVVRKEGFAAPIKLALKDAPSGLTMAPVTLGPAQNTARVNIRAGANAIAAASISIVGSAKIGPQEVVREAVAAEDRMQAFLWRHLVPASELKLMVFDPRQPIPSKRPLPPRVPAAVIAALPAPTVSIPGAASASEATAATPSVPPKPKFTKQQIAGRLRQLKLLYEEGLLTNAFYEVKVSECDTPGQ